MGEVRDQCETKEPVYGGIIKRDDLHHNLEESAVPLGLLDGELTGYNDFLAERRTLMAGVIRDYYHSL